MPLTQTATQKELEKVSPKSLVFKKIDFSTEKNKSAAISKGIEVMTAKKISCGEVLFNSKPLMEIGHSPAGGFSARKRKVGSVASVKLISLDLLKIEGKIIDAEYIISNDQGGYFVIRFTPSSAYKN